MNNAELASTYIIDSKGSQNFKTQSTNSTGVKDPFQFGNMMKEISRSHEIKSIEIVSDFSFEEGKVDLAHPFNHFLSSIKSNFSAFVILITDHLFRK